MNRMATRLALVFLEEPREVSHWNVEFLRELSFVPQLLPANTGEPVSPIVEWVARRGIHAPGRVVITMQGIANPHHPGYQHRDSDLRSIPLRKRAVAVTLIFDACFRKKE